MDMPESKFDRRLASLVRVFMLCFKSEESSATGLPSRQTVHACRVSGAQGQVLARRLVGVLCFLHV